MLQSGFSRYCPIISVTLALNSWSDEDVGSVEVLGVEVFKVGELVDVKLEFVVHIEVSEEGSGAISFLIASLVSLELVEVTESWVVESGLQGVEEEQGRRGFKMSYELETEMLGSGMSSGSSFTTLLSSAC